MIPSTLEQFLKATGWDEADRVRLDRMRKAFNFFTRHVCAAELDKSTTDPKFGASAWSFKIDGRVTNLCAWMQGICFDDPVDEISLKVGSSLKAFRAPVVPRGGKPSGHWFTDLREKQDRVAIKPGQSTEHQYKVRVAAAALKSTAGDMMVDWNMNPKTGKPEMGKDYWYRKGGGVQYFIADASVLAPV